jgi:predicted nucleic acid-binding protein
MNINRSTLLFFDASCLIAAAGSPTGGSGFLLSLCARSLLRGAVSQIVLLEAERNIRRKLNRQASQTFRQLLLGTPLIVAPIPPLSQQFSQIVTKKDEHVIAAVLAISAPYLLTLDKQLEEQVNQADIPVRAFSPGGFIKTILPHHVDFPSLRA